MDCPFCNSKNTQVINSRKTKGGLQIWRRRKCLYCQKVFTSYERIDLSFIIVIKVSGKNEPFTRSKLFNSIYQACSGLKDQAEIGDAITETVESKLLKTGRNELTSNKISKLVLQTLKHYHLAAFIRYLSYRTDLANNKQLKEQLSKF